MREREICTKMTLFNKLLAHREKISVIGLGYVGMPLAVAFARKLEVIGYDNNNNKIELYKRGFDITNEVGNEAIKKSNIDFTADEKRLIEAKFHIVAVPTPINADKTPNLNAVMNASMTLGKRLTPHSIVVYESTVYPGVTEDICIPLLEKESGLKCGDDFSVGYSPERINPGDKQHRLDNIVKIVSGINHETVEEIARVYELIIEAGIHRVSEIKVAEAAKVVENSQRDINIAFMNELAMVFDRMGIDTNEVLNAMNTKWNALGFRPGLVGGHCIGVDPYYFVYEAEKLGYHSQIILAGRKINDGMGCFVADAAIRKMILAGMRVKDANVVIFGIAFKENCPDARNSKVVDIIMRLNEYGINPQVVDPQVDVSEVKHSYGINVIEVDNVNNADCIIFAVAHNEFATLSADSIDKMFRATENNKKVLIDVKGILKKSEFVSKGYSYWSL